MRTCLFLLAAVASGLTLVAEPAGASADQRAPSGQIVVIQAVPGSEVSVAVDGKSMRSKAAEGSVVGPFTLSAGRHELMFSGVSGGKSIKTMLTVKAGSSSDVVLHRPASLSGAPVVNTYRTPLSPIGPGKARLLLAHTATVAPADVSFDGKIVFTNIANGEFAEADVPSGSHRVALLPTGQKQHPILGPLDVTLAARTVTMVYAVGDPQNGSMNAIVHTLRLPKDGSSAPQTIDTGSAGLASGVDVTPFSAPAGVAGPTGTAQHGPPIWFAGSFAMVLLVALVSRRRRVAVTAGGRSHARRSSSG